jgi:hypothetical protein
MKATAKVTAPAEPKTGPIVFTKGHAMFQATGRTAQEWMSLTEASKKAYAKMAEDYERLSKQ